MISHSKHVSILLTASLILSLTACAGTGSAQDPAPAGASAAASTTSVPAENASVPAETASAPAEPASTPTESPAPEVSSEPTPTPEPAHTDVAILTTTDMHGKCWDTNVLTDARENNNMLRAATAVKEIREEFGPENVILLDNGDLFQGTPVSQEQLFRVSSGESADPLAMAVCLTEMGYDAMTVGNHEFNFPWPVMSGAYQYLTDNNVTVLAANAVWDGSDGVHEANTNVFTPYITRTITVDGHEHTIGILGLGNTDITRWDLPENYPGIRFAHLENENYSLSYEASLYIPQMIAEGCEFIIVSYHGGLGEKDSDLVFGVSTEDQGTRLAYETDNIDLLVLGHDHISSYSNTVLPDQNGGEVPVVNGGGQELTRSVYRFTEEADGSLAYTLVSDENLKLGDYEADPSLQEKMKPYADLAESIVSTPVGTVTGEWDGNADYYLSQTDSMDLVNRAAMYTAEKRIKEKYGVRGENLPEAFSYLDHMEVDMSMTSSTASGGYVVQPGELSYKDLFKLYRYTNTLLVVPMTGAQIRGVVEENAAQRLSVRVHRGNVSVYTCGDSFTNLIFGGLNFEYDMAKPEGQRARIHSFSSGKPFEDDKVYLVAVNNYILGNDGCGLRGLGEADALWSQSAEAAGETFQDLIAEYIRDTCAAKGSVTTDEFNWTWMVTYLDDPAALAPYEGEAAATLSDTLAYGNEYILFQEAEGLTFTSEETGGGLGVTACTCVGDVLAAPLPENALIFTALLTDNGSFALQSRDGKYLTASVGGGLTLTEEMAEDGSSLWTLAPARGGSYVINAGEGSGDTQNALEYYGGHFTTYRFLERGDYVFNFYALP